MTVAENKRSTDSSTDPDAKPAHVMRFRKQLDLQGVIPEQADQAVRHLRHKAPYTPVCAPCRGRRIWPAS